MIMKSNKVLEELLSEITPEQQNKIDQKLIDSLPLIEQLRYYKEIYNDSLAEIERIIKEELTSDREDIKELKNIIAHKNLITELQGYVKFLNEVNENPIAIATIHGWICPQEDMDKGIEFREKIQQLISKL